MILASQQRTTTGIDLLNKLVRLHPRKRFDKIEWISQQERYLLKKLSILD